MRCNNCGLSFSSELEYCPHCGASNLQNKYLKYNKYWLLTPTAPQLRFAFMLGYWVTILAACIFGIIVSLLLPKHALLVIGLTVLTVFLYYYFWLRYRYAYITIDGDRIILHKPLAKNKAFLLSEIREIILDPNSSFEAMHFTFGSRIMLKHMLVVSNSGETMFTFNLTTDICEFWDYLNVKRPILHESLVY